MKTRNGLVSNSSSASFVITWKCTAPSADNIKLAVDHLLGLNSLAPRCECDIDTMADIVIRHSSVLKSKAYRTSYFIPMYNDLADIPASFMYFVTAMTMSGEYEVIDIRIDNE